MNLFNRYLMRHFILCASTYRSQLILYIQHHGNSSYHFIMYNLEFHFVFTMLGISFHVSWTMNYYTHFINLCISNYASYHMHLIKCISSYMHLYESHIMFWSIYITYYDSCTVLNILPTVETRCTLTNRPTDGHCHAKSCYRS